MPLEEFWEGEASDETESEELPAEKNRSPRVMGKVLEKAFLCLVFYCLALLIKQKGISFGAYRVVRPYKNGCLILCVHKKIKGVEVDFEKQKNKNKFKHFNGDFDFRGGVQ